MARQRGGTDFQLIEKIFDQLSSSVAIALLKDEKLAYEFYGGRKAALSAPNNGASGKSGGGAGKAAAGADAGGGGTQKAGKGFRGFGGGKGAKNAGGAEGGGRKNAAVPEETGVNRATRFNIGTASSLFTGALVVKMLEFGEIRLSDKVRRFIPAFPYNDVTVYHLLTHSSGLSSEILPLPENYTAKREFYRKLYDAVKRGFMPGEKSDPYLYGYAILADVVETVSGHLLEDLASEFLFVQLGMKYTTFNGGSLRDNQFVVPWNHRENRFMGELHAKQPTGHSGVYTTVLDMIRFGRMFLNGGEFEGKSVFLESSVDFMLREISGGRFMRTPLFMIKRKVDVFGCFSEKLSVDAVALTGDTGSIIFIDPVRRAVGTALTNSTWVHAVNQNYSNIVDILMSI